MRYAKLINNYPYYAPNPILHNGLWYGNPPGSVYEAEGYKPVTYTVQPEPPGVGWWIETWAETEDALAQGWTWREATDEDEGGGAVLSVNGKTGAVTLTAADVGALPEGTAIPPTVTEQTVSGWGFTKNTGTYSKPSGGIPASDLAAGVIPDISGKANAADVYTKTEINQKLVGAMDYKGTKATVSALPTSGNKTGDVWHITADGSECAWDGSEWQNLGTVVDISGKADKSAFDAHTGNTTIHVTAADKTAWNGKQDAISDLATIRSGAAAGATAVQPGSLATVATSGSYNDLSNKPTIPTVPTDEISANTAARHTHSNKTVLDGITAAKLLPTVTTSDNDKFLRVVSGAWAATTVPSAETASF